jgi:hypothetical protein
VTTSNKNKEKTGKSEESKGQEKILKAGEQALNAKEEAKKAIGQVYEKSREFNPLDQTLLRLFGETEQAINRQARRLLDKDAADSIDIPSSPEDSLPIDIYPEIRRKMEESGVVRINSDTDELPEEEIRREIDKFIEETKRIRKEARQALNEADITRRAARITVSQAKQEALQMAEQAIANSREEYRTLLENAEAEVRLARQENLRYQEEAEAARNEARSAINMTEEKMKEATEEIARAREESRQAKEAAEASIKRVNEQLIKARHSILSSIAEDAEDISPIPENISETDDDTLQVDDNTSLRDRIKELYDPLHSISGFTRMMLDDNIADTAAQKEFLGIILEQSEQLKQRLDQLSQKNA